MSQQPHHWIDFRRDSDMQIEAIRAHFTGHAYDPHWHDSYLIGVTEQGIQQFHSRRERHRSRPGTVFLLEPGDLHDGDAIDAQGFTYRMLYLQPALIAQHMAAIFADLPAGYELNFAATLSDDRPLAQATFNAWQHLAGDAPLMVKEAALQQIFSHLTRHQFWRKQQREHLQEHRLAEQTHEFLQAHYGENIGLDEIASLLEADRFRLTRAFQQRFGLAPHAWLIHKRLNEARRLLAAGQTPVAVAAEVGFADQSHLGRWFRRVYQLTPADYRQRCTNLPDRPIRSR